MQKQLRSDRVLCIALVRCRCECLSAHKRERKTERYQIFVHLNIKLLGHVMNPGVVNGAEWNSRHTSDRHASRICRRARVIRRCRRASIAAAANRSTTILEGAELVVQIVVNVGVDVKGRALIDVGLAIAKLFELNFVKFMPGGLIRATLFSSSDHLCSNTQQGVLQRYIKFWDIYT